MFGLALRIFVPNKNLTFELRTEICRIRVGKSRN